MVKESNVRDSQQHAVTGVIALFAAFAASERAGAMGAIHRPSVATPSPSNECDAGLS